MQTLIQSYVDGELDTVSTIEVEHHLRDCSACAQACEDLQRLQTALHARALYHRAPPGLQLRLQATLEHGLPGTPEPEKLTPERPATTTLAPTSSAPAPGAVRVRLPQALVWWWGGLAMVIVCLTMWSVSLRRGPRLDAAEARVAQEVVAGHVRSLLADHLTDLTSADQHTVQTWFKGKLTFAAAVPKPSPAGATLVGGRLDYVDNKPVAALVYQQQQHVINVFICPAVRETAAATGGSVGAAPQTLTRRGYHVCYMTLGDLTYWAVSDLDEASLTKFTTQVIPSVANHCP
ncbi:MAG: anti-sigma factor [Abitibacteriaceae bacterium]|nr:anti-sigma factor [Abditibacteriaceae bacterium]